MVNAKFTNGKHGEIIETFEFSTGSPETLEIEDTNGRDL